MKKQSYQSCGMSCYTISIKETGVISLFQVSIVIVSFQLIDHISFVI